MIYKELANDVRMPMLGLGTFRTSGAECERSVMTAIKAGYRLIDTAEAYGNEDAVGNAIARCGLPREELFITTKVNFRSYENARAAVEKSMAKLRVEYLDLVLLHWPFGNYYAAWRDLEKLCAEGKIRTVGVSNFDPDRLIDLISFNNIKPVINQIETHLYCQRKEHHAWEDKYGVAHQAYAPLGQGRSKEMFEEKTVKQLAAKYGKSPAQILLRFLLQNDVVVIPKSVREDRIAENINVFDFALTADEMEELAKLDNAAPMIGDPENPRKAETAMTW